MKNVINSQNYLVYRRPCQISIENWSLVQIKNTWNIYFLFISQIVPVVGIIQPHAMGLIRENAMLFLAHFSLQHFPVYANLCSTLYVCNIL